MICWDVAARNWLKFFCFLFSILVTAEQGVSWASEVTPLMRSYETKAVIWSVLAEDLDADGKQEIIMGGVDHYVYVSDRTGNVLWKYDVGGLPLSIAAGDVDGDGRKEIAVISEDEKGTLFVLKYGKGVAWTYSAVQALLCVAVGDLDGDGKSEVCVGSFSGMMYALDGNGQLMWQKNLNAKGSVTALAIGDIVGDKKAEIVAGVLNRGLWALNSSGKKLWRLKSKFKDKAIIGNKFKTITSIAIKDLNLDGKNDVVVGSDPHGMVTVLDQEGRIVWRKNFPDLVNRHSNAQIAVGNLLGDRKREVGVLLHGIITGGERGTSPVLVLDCDGHISRQSFADQNLVSMTTANIDDDSYSELLFSSATRGHRVYAVDFDKKDAPLRLPISQPDNIDRLIGDLASKKAEPARQSPGGARKDAARHVLLAWNIARDAGSVQGIKRLLDSFSSEYLSVDLMVTGVFEEDTIASDEYILPARFVRRKKPLYSQKEIIDRINIYDKLKIPYYVLLGTHRKLHMRLDTVEKILRASSAYLKGFIVNENLYSEVGEFEEYLGVLDKVMSLLHRYGGKKLIMDEYKDFWYKIFHDPVAFKRIFRPERRDILVPMYKTNNFKAPELNVGCLMGVWKAGLVKEWGFSAQDDAWKWESIFMNPPHDVLLRMEVMAASLGATYFRIEANGEFVERVGSSYRVTNGARRHRGLFHELCRKGVIRPVEDSGQVIISPLMLQVRANKEILPRKGRDQDVYWQNIYKETGPLAYKFSLQVAGDGYVPSFLYDMRHHYDGFFPKTPYGFVGIVPEWIDPLGIPGTKDYWVVDGKYLHKKNGKKYLTSQVKEQVIKDFRAGAQDLPFTAAGVFLAINEFEDEYRLYLIDPGQLDISDTKTTLNINLPGKDHEVIDVISGKGLSNVGSKVGITVPAGSFRVLKVRKDRGLKRPDTDLKQNQG